MLLAMTSLQLTAQAQCHVALVAGLAWLVVLLGHGQGHTADTDWAALGQATNQPRITVRIATTHLTQTTTPGENATSVASAVPVTHGARATVVVRSAKISVARFLQLLHSVRILVNHIGHGVRLV